MSLVTVTTAQLIADLAERMIVEIGRRLEQQRRYGADQHRLSYVAFRAVAADTRECCRLFFPISIKFPNGIPHKALKLAVNAAA